MDLQYHSSAEHGRFEQIVSQFLIKCLHMILDSRIPSVHQHVLRQDGESKKSNKWFNLLLGDRPPGLNNLSFWHRNLVQPMIIDIILVQETSDSSSNHTISSAFESGKSVETLLERWIVQYEYSKSMFPQVGECSSSYKKMYKKLIILTRALYSTMRMLPAYRPFRKLSSKAVRTCDFDINYKISSFGSPLSKDQEKSMKPFNFSAESAHGRLSVSVTYRQSLSGLNLEASALFPPQIIVDYAASPAADPFRAFPSRSPSSVQSHRPHSWTGGRTAPVYKNIGFDDYQLSPPFSPSPSSYSPNTHQLAETAPVSTHQMMGRSSKFQLPPTSALGTIRTSRKSESSKVLKDGKDDSGRFSAVLSSSGSPRYGFSRSSSRLSLQDDLDDVFSCPFIVDDDVDPSPLRYRHIHIEKNDTYEHNKYSNPERSSTMTTTRSSMGARKSQDAAVGALVHMLRTAPPLRQDPQSSQYSASDGNDDKSETSGVFFPRKISDAMEELNMYREMKQLLLSKSTKFA